MRLTVLFGVSLALVLGRAYFCVTTPPEPVTWVAVYKDIAHVWVGGLAGALLLSRSAQQWQPLSTTRQTAKTCCDLFWFLIVVELVAAFAARKIF